MEVFHGSSTEDDEEAHPECGALERDGLPELLGLFLFRYFGLGVFLEGDVHHRQALGDPPVVVAREVTKVHEEFLEGEPPELLTELAGRTKLLGEFTVFVRPDKKTSS